jgi:ABC-type polysaccharide/polyol phosphate export permease
MLKKSITEILRLGWAMGSHDFRLLGVGTKMGRLWPTIGLALRIVMVGLIFALLFGLPSSDYIPWLATGWAIWGMMGSIITDTSNTYNQSRGLMLAINIPRESFVVKVIVREALLLVQNSILVLGVALLFQLEVGFEVLLIVPGLFLSAIFFYGLGMILGPIVARSRDLGPLISSVIGVMFFVLPIMWKPESIESELAHLILGLNPLYHYLQIVRLPLLGEVPTNLNYLLAAVGAIVFLIAGNLVMKITRNKIIYWTH